MKENKQKIVYCTICGVPNVGKSTFLNKILNQELAPVSKKAQTTRVAIKGVLNSENTQIIFTDTPGVFKVKNGILEKKIVKNAWANIKLTDLLIIMTDAENKIDSMTKMIIEAVKKENIDFIFLINKSDQKKISERIAIIDYIIKEYGDKKIFCVSSITGRNISEVIDYIKSKSYESDWIFKKNEITDVSFEKIISEKIRAYFFSFLKEELPYQIETIVEDFKENEEEININILIFCSKESHKSIIIGKKAENIKKCLSFIIPELKKWTEKKVKIKIKVKIHEKWKEIWENLDKEFKVY